MIKEFFEKMKHGEVTVKCGAAEMRFSCVAKDFLQMDDGFCIAAGSGESSRSLYIKGAINITAADNHMICFSDQTGNTTVTITK